MGIVLLLQHFRWTWVGLLAVDNENGEKFMQALAPMLIQNGICPAFIERTPGMSYAHDITDLFFVLIEKYPVMMESRIKVFVVDGEYPSMENMRFIIYGALLMHSPTPNGKVWIVTSQWDFSSTTIQKNWDLKPFHGALSFAVRSKEPPGFQNFLRSLRTTWARGDGFIQHFWEHAFNCSLNASNALLMDVNTCTGEEELESLPGPFFEMSMISHSYSVYNAAQAVARVLHAVFEYRSKYTLFGNRRGLNDQTMQPWQVTTTSNMKS